MSPFAGDLIEYKENPKDSTKKTIIHNKQTQKVSGYKVNVQKSTAFLHTNNKSLEKEMKKTIPLQLQPKE